jgi:aerobic carbon-monoxide dehydrogenase small subunit
MRKLGLTINGRQIEAEAEPRTHLADFLRGQQFLTGTHLGCEHGVCGACTVLIDGSPARSCITYAVACDGAEITTIEGLDDDQVAARLREAFSAHHALQCGYCTPGMLISARDIITRLPDADEARIRLELSGNLCRCTGYVGIVAAIKDVLGRRESSVLPAARMRTGLGPVGAHPPTAGADISKGSRPATALRRKPAPSRPATALTAAQWEAVETEGVELVQSFRVPYPREQVWRFFEDLDQVARCMPGARLTAPAQDRRAEGQVDVKLGPIVSAFAGVIEIERDPKNFRGTARAAGRDSRSASNARALVSYRIASLDEAASQVDISMKLLLTGALAQFSRSGLVKDVADHLTAMFARNLAAALSGAPATAEAGRRVLDAGALARAALWSRLTGLLRRIFGR